MSVAHINGLSEFNQAINEGKPVIVDFFAVWCGPCKMIAPFFEETAGSNTDIKFVKVDVDVAQEICVQYKVRSMPTFLLFKNGQEVTRFSGASKDGLLNMVKSAH
ncbi:Thioredoxin [Entamoeba marina]